MKKTTVLTLAALVGAASSAHAQVSTFGYLGEVIEISDNLGLFGAASEGSDASGSFTLDLDAEAGDNPMGGDFIGYFEALSLDVVFEEFGMGGVSPDDFIFVLATNNLTYSPVNGDTGEVGDEITVDVLEIGMSVWDSAQYDFGGISVRLTGTEDWFDDAGGTIPDPLSMGFENLLSAEVVIEFFQLQGGGGGDAPGDRQDGDGNGVMVSSRAVINISSMSNAAGTVATIGCRSFQFAAPVAQFDFFDISGFITEFTAQTPAADMNSDGMFNFFDITEFINQVQTSCSN